MSHGLNRSNVTATLAVAWLAAATVSGEREPTATNVYFGSLGAHEFTSGRPGGYRADFERGRSVDGLDFLAIATRTASAELRRSAAAVNAAFEGRFAALWGWQFGSVGHGNVVSVLGLQDIAEATVPYGRYDWFFRDWLPRHKDVTDSTPVVHLPQPKDKALDYGMRDVDSIKALSNAAAPFVRTIEITKSASGAGDRDDDTSEWPSYLDYLNVGFRVAPTADVERTASTRDADRRRTAIVARGLTMAHILEGIRERRVYSSEDRNLKVSFSINGEAMGSIVAIDAGTPLRIEVTFADLDEPRAYYWVSLRRDEPGGDVEASRELIGTDYRGNGRVVFTPFKRGHRDEYFLVHIRQTGSHGVDTVWTAPIWLTSAEAVK